MADYSGLNERNVECTAHTGANSPTSVIPTIEMKVTDQHRKPSG